MLKDGILEDMLTKYTWCDHRDTVQGGGGRVSGCAVQRCDEPSLINLSKVSRDKIKIYNKKVVHAC